MNEVEIIIEKAKNCRLIVENIIRLANENQIQFPPEINNELGKLKTNIDTIEQAAYQIRNQS